MTALLNSMRCSDRLLTQGQGTPFTTYSPITGQPLCEVRAHSLDQVDVMIVEAEKVFKIWREVPAPRRHSGQSRFRT